MKDYLDVNIYDFKTHFSKYLRIVEEEKNGVKAVIIHRNGKPAGILIPYKPPPLQPD